MDDISIGLACTLFGAVLSFLAFQRNKWHDIRADTKEEAETAVDEIRLDNKARDREMNEFNTRLIRVEESTKSAHKRIDGIEKGEM